ncbi:MAG: baseplate J/gp47 family protein [Actinobacteria bacterium]|nr:baseplate J/gp47 family protein [Actinomycetota bacterium]
MADEFLRFLPLFPGETEDVIRARWEGWANEGLNPAVDVDRWTDTREGSMFWVCTTPGIRESAREYDLMGTEVPASSFPALSWAEYLDDLAELVEVTRLPGTRATGTVTFTGPGATVIAAGTVVGVAPPDEESEAAEFEVKVGGTIPGGGSVALAVAATAEGADHNVAIGAITAVISSLPGVTVTNAAPTLGGTDPEDDERLRARVLAEYTESRGGNELDYRRWLGEMAGVGHITIIPQFAGQGTVMAIITDPAGSPLPVARVTEIQLEMDPPGWSSKLTAAVDLPVATIPVESVAGVSPAPGFVRLGNELVGYTGFTAGLSAPTGVTATPSASGGTLASGTYYYKVSALNALGETIASAEVSAVVVGPTGSVSIAWGAVTGATSYRIYRGTAAGAENTYYTDAATPFVDTGAAGTAGTPRTTNGTSALTGCTGGTALYAIGATISQAGRGGGIVPVNHHAVIVTATALLVDVAASVELDEEYALGGVGGALDPADDIQEAVRVYVEGVESGGEIVRAQVLARIAQVPGVHDAANITLNGVAANLAVPGSANPQVPFLDDLFLTEAIL